MTEFVGEQRLLKCRRETRRRLYWKAGAGGVGGVFSVLLPTIRRRESERAFAPIERLR